MGTEVGHEQNQPFAVVSLRTYSAMGTVALAGVFLAVQAGLNKLGFEMYGGIRSKTGPHVTEVAPKEESTHPQPRPKGATSLDERLFVNQDPTPEVQQQVTALLGQLKDAQERVRQWEQWHRDLVAAQQPNQGVQQASGLQPLQAQNSYGQFRPQTQMVPVQQPKPSQRPTFGRDLGPDFRDSSADRGLAGLKRI